MSGRSLGAKGGQPHPSSELLVPSGEAPDMAGRAALARRQRGPEAAANLGRRQHVSSAALAVALLLLLLACAAAPAAAAGPALAWASNGEPGTVDEVLSVADMLQGEEAQNKFRRPSAVQSVLRRRFLVTLVASATDEDKQAFRRLVRSQGGQVLYTGQGAWSGMAIRAPAGRRRQAALMQQLVDSGAVKAVEADGIVSASVVQSPLGSTSSPATGNWGIDRIDQVSMPLDNSYSYERTGRGVTIYLLDSGIRFNHTEFVGTLPNGTTYRRAKLGFDPISSRGEDCNGHGTHTAAIAGGNKYGVAKEATLVAVKVLDCNNFGYWSTILAAIDWVTTNHNGSDCVVNLSLGSPATSDAVWDAISASVASGCVYTVAAGNGNTDACTYLPANSPDVITVAATAVGDVRYPYSNVGPCVEVFAPGRYILSANFNSSTGSVVKSGTSMAAPHVAGVVAQYFEANPGAHPRTVREAILGAAVRNKVTDSQGDNLSLVTPNLLIFSRFIT